jgi:hypothetical protein
VELHLHPSYVFMPWCLRFQGGVIIYAQGLILLYLLSGQLDLILKLSELGGRVVTMLSSDYNLLMENTPTPNKTNCKIMPGLNEVPCGKAVWRSGGITQSILKPGSR